MKENQPLALDQLGARQSRLSNIIEQRWKIDRAIERKFSRLKPGDSWEGDVFLGKSPQVRERLSNSLERLQERLAQTEESIADLTVGKTLAYCKEVALRKRQLAQIREYTKVGRLPEEALEKREAEFRELAARPGHDRELKTGITILRKRREREKEKGKAEDGKVAPKETIREEKVARLEVVLVELEKQVLPKAVVNLETREVKIGERTAKMSGAINWAVFSHLARNPQINIPQSKIAQITREAGSKDISHSVGLVINRLRKKLENNPKKPQLVKRFGSIRKPSYCFNAEVEFYGEQHLAADVIEEITAKEPVVLSVKAKGEAVKEFLSLPNGATSEALDLTKKEKKVLEGLLHASEEKPVEKIDLARFVYGDDSPQKTAVRRLEGILTGFRKKLEKTPWRVLNKVPKTGRIRGQKALYYLAQSEIKEIPAEEKMKAVPHMELSEIEPSPSVLPKAVVNLATKEVQIGERIIKIGGRVNWAVFSHLARKSPKNIPWKEITQIVWDAGSKESHRPVGHAIDHLRRKLEVNPRNPQLVIHSGGTVNSQYRFDAEVEFVEKKEEPLRPEEAVVEKILEEKPTPVELKTGEKVEEEALKLSDGTLVADLNLSELEAKVLEGLLYSSEESPVTRTELARFTYSEEVSQAKADHRVELILTDLRKKLKKTGSRIVNTLPKGAHAKGQISAYYLTSIEIRELVETKEEEVVPVEAEPTLEKKPEEKERVLPKAQAYPETKEVQIGDRRVKLGDINWAVFVYLSQRPQEGSSQSKIAEIAREAGSIETHSLAGNVMYMLKRLIEVDPRNPQLIIRSGEGQNSKYRLDLDVEFVVKKEEVSEEVITAERPEEQAVSMPEEALIEVEAQKPVEEVISPEPEIIVVPYEPLEEEKRSEEETRILMTVTSGLATHSQLYFDDLQRRLRSSERMVDGGKYRIYSTLELKEKFTAAFQKLAEESEIPNLHAVWSEKEQTLWDQLQELAKRLTAGNRKGLLSCVKKEIDKAEREFYKIHPPTNGKDVSHI